MYNFRNFRLRRYLKTENDTNSPTARAVSTISADSLRSQKRNLMYRLSAYSLDDHGRILSKAETSIKSVSLVENEVRCSI